mmetsp:Transcript_45679/g.51521  ORF Transcript_45679/g.51521 Transcript_45679/m.51521 type:complete len:115 (+) Transcript_45679:204-548(+)
MPTFKAPLKELMCSRFINRTKRQKFKESKDGYVQNVQNEKEPLLELIDQANDTVAAAAAALAAFREEKAQESNRAGKEANVQLRLLKDKMIARVLGKNDPRVINWNDTATTGEF